MFVLYSTYCSCILLRDYARYNNLYSSVHHCSSRKYKHAKYHGSGRV